MNSKNIKPDDSEWLAMVKRQPCSVCLRAGPSAAHHTKQGNHRTAIALCFDCHQGSKNGWHGQKRMWAVMKVDENDALNVTLRHIWSEMRRNR